MRSHCANLENGAEQAYKKEAEAVGRFRFLFGIQWFEILMKGVRQGDEASAVQQYRRGFDDIPCVYDGTASILLQRPGRQARADRR
jgi:hypothetical protein